MIMDPVITNSVVPKCIDTSFLQVTLVKFISHLHVVRRIQFVVMVELAALMLFRIALLQGMT